MRKVSRLWKVLGIVIHHWILAGMVLSSLMNGRRCVHALT
nr:MAG TPA_asm: hypothetical protein [Caudoviricetes sp.]